MPPDDPPLPRAFGARRADIILTDYLQHGGAGHPNHGGHAPDRQGDRREDKAGPVGDADGGEPPQFQRKEKQKHQAQPKGGNGSHNQGQSKADRIKNRILLYGRYDSDGNADHNGQPNAEESKRQGVGKTGQNLFHHRKPGTVRIPEVERNGSSNVFYVPEQEILIEPHLLTQFLDGFEGGVFSQNHLRRVTRSQGENCKNNK